MSKRKFKYGDKVIVYGKVKATVLGENPFGGYDVRYEKHISTLPDTGTFPGKTIELVEIFESPLYQAMREDE